MKGATAGRHTGKAVDRYENAPVKQCVGKVRRSFGESRIYRLWQHGIRDDQRDDKKRFL
jgi:hypothetical protein